MIGLANVRHALGEHGAACELLQSALELRRTSLGEENRLTQQTAVRPSPFPCARTSALMHRLQ